MSVSLRRCVPLIGLAVMGCGEPSSDAPTSGPGMGTGGAPVEAPVIFETEPVEVRADQTDVLRFAVEGVALGATQVLIDGEVVTVAGVSDPLDRARLSDGQLQLPLQGAMAPGTHFVQLSSAERGESNPLELEIIDSQMPTVTATLDDLAVENDITALRDGVGGFAAVPDGEPAELILRAVQGDGWAEPQRRSVPGLDPGAAAVALAFDGEGQARVAWLDRGSDGQVWMDIGDGPVVGLSPGDLPLEGRSYIELGAPRFVDPNHLAVAVHAPLAGEDPRPGDRLVVPLALEGGTVRAYAPVVPDTTSDLDRLGPAASPPNDPVAFVRLGGRRPRVLAAAPGGLSVRALPGDVQGIPGDWSSLASVHGSFDGITVLGLRASGVPVMLRITGNAGVGREVTPSLGPLPDAPTSGPVTPSVLGGFPVFVVPYGAGQEAVALVGLGDNSVVIPLGVGCDEVAVGRGAHAKDIRALACLRGGELLLGNLRLVRDP